MGAPEAYVLPACVAAISSHNSATVATLVLRSGTRRAERRRQGGVASGDTAGSRCLVVIGEREPRIR